jgi:putative inorganic carbon (hco3(-)) transporter
MSAAVLLTLLVVAVGSIIAVQQPFVGLLVYLWLDFMRPHDFFVELRAYRPMLVVGAMTLAAAGWHHRRRLLGRWRPLLPLLTLLVMVLLATIVSSNREQSLPTLVAVAKMLVVVWLLIALVSTKQRFQAVLWAISTALLVLAVCAIVEGFDRGLMSRFTIDRVIEGPPGNGDGPLRDNNNLARVLALSLPLWWMLVASSRRWLRVMAVAGFVATVAGIEFTFSRSGFLAMVVAVSGIALAYRPLWRAALIPPLFVAALLILSPRPYLDRIASIGHPTEDTSVQGRVEIWKEYLHAVAKAPVLGGGPGTVRVGPHRRTSHNVFIEVFAETGLLGLLAYGWVLAATLLDLYRLRQRAGPGLLRTASYGLQAALLAYLTAGLALSAPFQGPLFALIGLALALGELAETQYGESGNAAVGG